MRKPTFTVAISLLLFIGAAVFLAAQQADIKIGVSGEQQTPRIAVPDIPGPPAAAAETEALNTTLWDDLESSGRLAMISKSFYPRTAPRRPEDFQAGDKGLPTDPGDRGLWLQGWGQPPVSSLYLAFGTVDIANDRLVLSGYLYDVSGADVAAAHVFGKRYYAPMTIDGAQRLAHDFSTDILARLGLGPGLAGSKIYYVSRQGGVKEIWSMDYNGQNQKQITFYKNITLTPAVSADGGKLAFTTYVEGTPGIYVHSLETNRRLTFYNQVASLNTTPAFTPDGNTILFASSATGWSQIYAAGLDGRNLRRISYSRSLDVHPMVNPKTGAQIAFVSGRSGPPQVYLMDMDGANVRKLSPGGGDAVQPSWDPQGENIAFAWTQGFEPGNYNIFVINVATQQLVQLTHGAGRNEHPSWSPSGTHIVFSSDRSGGTQLWSMRADGTQLRKLTSQGQNEGPVWAIR